ncbi:hypothetical protein Tco_0697116 [Tanacetum coccineum]
MSRTNSQDEIISEEQQVPRANRLVIKKNNQRVASDSHITDTMPRFMPPSDPNNTYIKPSSKNQILEFIKTLGYDEDPETKMIAVSKMVATRLHQPWRAILSVLNRCLTRKDSSWDTDEFEWQTVKRSSRPTKMSKLLYTRFTKLIIDYILYTTRVFLAYQILIPDAMISDAIKKKEGYTYYMAKKVESEKAKIVDEPEEQHVSPVKSGRGKGFMYYGDQVVNAPNKLKNDVVLRKTRSLTIAEEGVIVANTYVEWGQKLKGPAVDDPAVQSLLDLRKGSKANTLESLKQTKQVVAGEG